MNRRDPGDAFKGCKASDGAGEFLASDGGCAEGPAGTADPRPGLAGTDEILSSVPDHIFAFDSDGRFAFANACGARALGREPEQLLGKAFGDIGLPGEIAKHLESRLRQSIASGKPYHGEIDLPGENGLEHYEYVLTPVPGGHGKARSVIFAAHDVTRWQRLEDQLRASDLRFRSLMDANIIGIFICAIDGPVLEANDEYLKILGYDRKDLQAGRLNWRLMTPLEYRVMDRKATLDLYEKGYHLPYEKEYYHKDGSRVPVQVGASLLDRRARTCIGYVVDLSDHKRRELLLKKYRMMFDTIRDIILFLRPDGSIVEANYAAVEAYGYTHNELLGMNLRDLIGERNRSRILNVPEECFKHGCRYEINHQRRDGSAFSIDLICKGIVLDKQKLLVAVARDITARKQAEEALRRSEARLARAQQLAHIGSWEWDVAHNRLTWSTETYRIFGADPEGFPATFESFLYFVHPNDRQRVQEVMEAALLEDRPLVVDFRIIREDGGLRHVHYESDLELDDRGQPTRLFGTIQDTTDRQRGEEMLKDAKADAELYIDLLRHDINNLNHIAMVQLGFLQSVRGLDEEEQELIARTMDALGEVTKLISNVRKLQAVGSRMEASRPVDAGQLLLNIIAKYRNTPGREISIRYRPAPQSLVMANDLLKDVFENVVENSLKHSGGPLEIAIESSLLRQDERDYLMFKIEDNGPGIHDEMKEKVFLRLQKGMTEAHGKGLGLFLVKTLVEGFGGQVWAEDRVQGDQARGVRIVIVLPAAAA